MRLNMNYVDLMERAGPDCYFGWLTRIVKPQLKQDIRVIKLLDAIPFYVVPGLPSSDYDVFMFEWVSSLRHIYLEYVGGGFDDPRLGPESLGPCVPRPCDNVTMLEMLITVSVYSDDNACFWMQFGPQAHRFFWIMLGNAYYLSIPKTLRAFKENTDRLLHKDFPPNGVGSFSGQVPDYYKYDIREVGWHSYTNMGVTDEVAKQLGVYEPPIENYDIVWDD